MQSVTGCIVYTIVNMVEVVLLIFQAKQSTFRKMFRAAVPFYYNAVHPYISLDKVGVQPLFDYSIKKSTILYIMDKKVTRCFLV